MTYLYVHITAKKPDVFLCDFIASAKDKSISLSDVEFERGEGFLRLVLLPEVLTDSLSDIIGAVAHEHGAYLHMGVLDKK